MTLATAYWCVLIAALLPYVWISLAKASGSRYDNRNPRAWLAAQSGNDRVQRANAAHLNAFEAFAPFAAGVVMAQLAGVAPGTIALLAVVFIALRVLHGVLFLAGVAPATIALLAVAFVALRVLHGVLFLAGAASARSLVWLAGFLCVLALLVLAALRIA